MNQNIQILEYADGGLNGGAAVHAAAIEHMSKQNEKDYSKAVREVIKEARAAVAEDVKEFGNRVRSYMSEFKINEGEARKRVAQHDPRMRALEQDPFGPIMVTGTQPPPSKADITVPAWTPPVHEEIAVIAIANVLFKLPRDPYGFITLSQAAEALRPYPDELQRAASEKLDAYTRAEISIAGLPGFTSENYPNAFKAAARRYPSLAVLYASGRLTSQSLRELLPQVQIVD